MTPISYNTRQAFLNNLVQYGIPLTCVTLFLSFDKITFILLGITIGIIICIATLITFIPYLDVYRKLSTLYTDGNKNLYVDKILVDKGLIESIHFESPGFGPKKNQYYIMTFCDLPAKVKEKNFNKNSIVFCEIETLSNWPNLNNKTQKLLSDMGIKHTVEYLTRK